MIFTRNPARRRSRGAAMAEFLVTLPALLVLGLGGIQSLFWHNAKATLNYATFEAARVGAVTHAQRPRMRQELGMRLAPLFGGDGSPGSALNAIKRASLDVQDPRYTQLEILNPTQEAFADFGKQNPETGKTEIPNDNLRHRSREVKSASGVNIQDANLLKLKVTYGYQLKVPMIDRIVPALLKLTDPKHILYYEAGRIPLVAYATVRMHSPAWPDGNASVGGGGGGGVVPGGGSTDDPGEGQPPGGDGTSNPQDPTDGQGGDNNTGGNGNPNDGSGTGNPGNGTTDPAPGDPAEELACEKPTPEEDSQGAPQEDQGFWGDLWDGIKDGAMYGYEFMKGFWEGIKDQIGDLVNLILHPIETVKGLIELGKAFYDDPVGTVKIIGEALGEDFSKLTQCGAFDQGKVIGKYVNPVFMVKLATKLSKFGDLAQAIRNVKLDMPCASFASGTPVLTTQGRLSIENVLKGISIESRNENSFVDAAQQVTNTFSRFVNHYHVLIVEDETIQVTDKHPLWVQGEGWREVRDIERGSIIATATGDARVLQNMQVNEVLKVHNFSVANTPNYFIGDGLIWAHNASIKCIEGNLKRRSISHSQSLKNQMINAGIDIPDGYAAHHVIPVDVAKNSKALEYAAKKLGYDIENSNNGIALPTDPEVAKQVGLPVHNGRHTNDYNKYVKAQLEELDKWWMSGGDDVTEMELFNRIYEIENSIKADLQGCKIFCQANDPNQA